METCKPTDTPMVEKSKLDEDPQGKAAYPTCYRGMIGTLMYLTTSRPDLVFTVCMCARVSTGRHLHQAFSTRMIGISHQKAWNAKHVLGDSEKAGRRRGRVMVDFKLKRCPRNLYATVLVFYKKVQGIDSYEFLLANKKYVVNADVFRTIFDICPRVEGVNFTDVPDDDTTLAFLIKLGYKENVDYPELIWEDLAFQIDHMKEKKSRRKNMPFPRFTKIPPKNSKGKGSQRKKTTDDSQEAVDVSEESEPEPKPVKRKTSSKRRVKKKVTLSVDDDVISDDPDTALELRKSISKAEAEEAEAARQVHATHARIVIESVPKPTRRRKSGKGISNPPKKLKGIPSLTLEEQEAVDIIHALKESKKTSKRQPGTRGLSKVTCTIPGVPDEFIIVSATSSKGIGTKPGVPDEEKDITKENVILKWGSKQESEYLKEDKLDDEEKDDEEGDAEDEGDDHISDVQDTDDDDDDEIESDEDYPIWEVMQNGNGLILITTDTQGQIKVLPPRTAEEILAIERERKARTTLLMALPEDHLANFHKMTDAKEMWDAIKSRFSGNDKSNKMQKFQSLLSQLEIHRTGVSTEDANHKFLRSLPSAWSQVSLIMRTKPGMDSLSFDDLYNNLRVFENDIKGSTASSSSTQNVVFVSENTSNTNDASTAYDVSNPSGHNSQYEQTSSYSLLANQSSCPQLDHKDLEQLDEFDLE
ncbi:hypothetical protein Tco_0937250 [Tanacetum coccineum]|uniref:Uncharacterized protein n=1 Tax=Tanacetum coccineum TaxID=301880 RepID=A0ABQ5DDP4_9ASTR